MSAVPTNHLAFTAPINPSGASPVLTSDQIWNGLLLKIKSAETFVPAAIQSTTVLSESGDTTVREVVFKADQRKVQETVTAYEPSRVVFIQPDGTTIQNIVSEGAEGEFYMTYTFEWKHPGVSEAELKELLVKQKAMSKMAVEGTIEALRRLVGEGKL